MTVPFVTTTGVQREPIRIVDTARGASAADGVVVLRVRVAEAWDGVRVEALDSTLVREVKAAALAVLMPDIGAPEGFVVKLHGAEVQNEALSLAAAGVKTGATLLLMWRRKRPVR